MTDTAKVWEPQSERLGERFKPEARREPPSQLFASLVKSDLPLGRVFDPRHLGDTIKLDKDGILGALDAQRLSPKELERLRGAYAEKLAAFETKLGKFFQEKDISTNPPPGLKILASGRVEVAGGHPDRQKIEKLFEVTPELNDGIQALASDAAKIRAAELAATGTHLTPLTGVLFDGARIRHDVEQRAAGRYGKVAVPTDGPAEPHAGAVDQRA